MEDNLEDDDNWAPSRRKLSGSNEGGGGVPEEYRDDNVCAPDSF